MGRPYIEYCLTERERGLLEDAPRLAGWFVKGCLRRRQIEISDADDLVSCCIFRMCRAARRFDPSRGKFTTYMIAQCLGGLQDYYRRKHEVVCLEWDIEEEKKDCIDSDFLRQCIESAKLTSRRRQVLLLATEYNFAEIGRILGCTQWNVFMVYQKGLEILRNYMRIHHIQMKDFAA